MKWNCSDIISACNGKCENTDWQTSSFSIDSRTTKQDDVFIALKTDNANGHDYIQNAVDNGAIAVIVSNPTDINIPHVIVNDTMDALTDIGKYARKKLTGKVIGITGSVGKTSVKDMLNKTLSLYGKTYATVGNLNNHLGVPLTLAHCPIDSEYIIIEMGMNSLGEIDKLTNITKPDVAIVVSVENNHLKFFNGIDEIAIAKAEIFNGLNTNGIAIYNHSTNCTDKLKQNAGNNVITYGNDNIKNTSVKNNQQLTTLNIDGNNFDLTINGLGNHRILNTLAVLNIINSLKLDITKSFDVIKNTTPIAGRGLLEKLDNISIYDETYNASPASMKSALQVLSATETTGRKIAVLGDMLELGEDSQQLHNELSNVIKNNDIDLVFACGKYMQGLFELLPDNTKGEFENNSSMLAPKVLESLKDGDCLMIKGSNGSNMKPIIDELKKG